MKPNQYYKISVKQTSETGKMQCARVDIFAEEYDKADQEMLIDLSDQEAFVILHTDEQCPEEAWIRIIGELYEDAFSDIRVSEWVVKDA